MPIGSLLVGGKALLACLIMALVITMINTFSIFIILPVAMLVYFVAVTLLRTIPRDDMQAIYGVIRRKAHRASTQQEEEHLEMDVEPGAIQGKVPERLVRDRLSM